MRGFTLIEMLLSLALTAILMTALLGVSVASSRNQRVMATASRQHTGESERLIRLLQRDILQAHTITVKDNELTLTGHCGIDPNTATPNLRPVRITYSLQSITDTQRWLTRTQVPLDELSTRNTWRSPVLCGIDQWTLTAVYPVDAKDNKDENIRPISIELTLHWIDQDKPTRTESLATQ